MRRRSPVPQLGDGNSSTSVVQPIFSLNPIKLVRNLRAFAAAAKATDFIEICVVGDPGVGKRSFCCSYFELEFIDPNVRPFGSKSKIVKYLKQDFKIVVDCWDNVKNFESFVRRHRSSLFVIAFALDDRDSFENVDGWIHRIRSTLESDMSHDHDDDVIESTLVNSLLVGMKSDTPRKHRQVGCREAKSKSLENGCFRYVECSAFGNSYGRALRRTPTFCRVKESQGFALSSSPVARALSFDDEEVSPHPQMNPLFDPCGIPRSKTPNAVSSSPKQRRNRRNSRGSPRSSPKSSSSLPRPRAKGVAKVFQLIVRLAASQKTQQHCVRKLREGIKKKNMVVEVLNELKLYEYIETFLQERIIYSDFELLNDEDLERLIPHEIPRRRFKNWLSDIFPDEDGSLGLSGRILLPRRKRDDSRETPSSGHTTVSSQDEGYGSLELSGLDGVPRTPTSSSDSGYEEDDVPAPSFNPVPTDLARRVDRTERVDQGSYGVVYRGVLHAGTEQIEVAIKEIVLHPPLTREMVEREVEIQYELQHPHVVGCHGCWFDFTGEEKKAHIVMEYCSNANLRKYMHKLHSYVEQLLVLVQLARGIQCIHSRGVVHRDLKPENVLVDGAGIIKISDYGSSRHTKSIIERCSLVGTVEYIPPELLQRSVYDPKIAHKIDIYSFGIIAWEVITKLAPFPQLANDNIFVRMRRIHAEGIRPDPLRIEDLELRSLITRCWNSSMDARPNIREILDVLKGVYHRAKLEELRIDEI